MAETLALQFLAAWRSGRACLHPTDTLPGLTFDPTQAAGQAVVETIKGRSTAAKPYLALVGSAALARRYFAPLPGDWDAILSAGGLWPGPLSVVWRAGALAPAALVGPDGHLGLRVPLLPVSAAWFRAVLDSVSLPMPTTSVNKSGEEPAATYAVAARYLSGVPDCFVPLGRGLDALMNGDECPADAGRSGSHPPALPSTIIRLHDDGGFTVLRAGAMDVARLTARAKRVG